MSQHNPPFQDVATALTNSLDRNGTGGMLASLNMNSQAITNGGAASFTAGTFSSVTATNSSGSYVSLSGGSSTGTGQLQFVLANTRVAFIYQPTTGTGAGTLVFGKDDGNGFTFTGGPLRIVDDQFYLAAFNANNFGINFKTGIAIQVDRSTNKFLFIQAGGVVASIDASGNLKVAGNITANTTP